PIITYASPIWWNTSASFMEKIRVLDRKCIRTCLKVYRSHYFAKLSSIENKEIKKILETPDQQIYITNHNSACLPPQAFIYFDKKGIIQDSNNVPTIYHWGRNVANK
ncbi:GSCOCG00009880001-RA-CDS, partial [Cotesia congregata]